MTDTPAHSKLGASNAKRWMHCPGSVRLNETIPEPPSSPYAVEGTRAHRIAELCLGADEPTAENYRGVEYFDPDMTTWRATDEMCDAVDVFLGAVYAVLGRDDELYVESKLDLSSVHPGMFGTADAIVIKPKTLEMHVFDFKYGAGVVVEVENNEQVKYYALGALKLFAKHGIQKVTCWIVQPRAPHADGPVRSVVYDPLELLDWQEELHAAAQRTENPNAPLVPGEWCKFCKAADAMVCPAFKDQAVASASDAFGQIVAPPAIESMSLEEIGRRLDQLPALKAYIKKLEEYADSNAREGRLPAGYKWIFGRGRRVYNTSETDVLFRVLEETGQYVARRACPSPAELEKLLGKENYVRVVSPVVEIRRAPKLVPETDKAPAITLDDVRGAGKASAFDIIAD